MIDFISILSQLSNNLLLGLRAIFQMLAGCFSKNGGVNLREIRHIRKSAHKGASAYGIVPRAEQKSRVSAAHVIYMAKQGLPRYFLENVAEIVFAEANAFANSINRNILLEVFVNKLNCAFNSNKLWI